LTVHDATSPGSSVLSRFLLARLGAVSWLVPPGLALEVLAQVRAEAGAAAPARRLRLLPPLLGVYFVLGLCLFSHLPYQEVLSSVAGLPAAPTALTGLRRRLGPRPLELLFGRVAGHLSPGTAPWSHVCGLLAVAWDGTALKLPASPENAAWAQDRGGRGGGHYPRARLVALAACGTRCLLAAAAGPFADGERTLAARLTGSLRPGMLLLADRGFYSWGLWHAAAATGAHLLWRVSGCLHLPVITILPDGSWLTRIDDPYQKQLRLTRERKRKSRPASRNRRPEPGRLPGAATVRVIEFTITVTGDDGTARTERYRLLTTLLDPRAAPAAKLAAAYARRWAIEIGHRWYPSSCAFSWPCSLAVAGFLFGWVPPGLGVVTGRACPALA
jgi:Insertion element 4 transposase N-terminal/Transposase DDE domain